MYEEDWALPTKDGKKIYGRWVRKSRQEKSEKAIVFVHGLGNLFDSLPCLPAAYDFARKGYDCVLFNLYDWRKEARHFNDGTIENFAQDLDFIISKKTEMYEKTFVIGHSYGGPILLNSMLKGIYAVSLWDPSYNIADWWPKWTHSKKNMIFFKGYQDALVPSAMSEEAMTYTIHKCRKLSKKTKVPLQVVHAGQGILHLYGESFHSNSVIKTDYILLKDADHSFTKLAHMKKLVTETHRWFSSF